MKFIARSYNKRTILTSIVLFIVIMDTMYRNLFISMVRSAYNHISDIHGLYIFDQILNLYRNTIAYTALYLIRIFDHTVSYYGQNNILQFENHQYIVSNQLGFLKIFYFILLLCIYPFPIKKTIAFLIGGLTTICLLLAIRLAFISSNVGNERLIIVSFDLIYASLIVQFFYYKLQVCFPLRKNYVIAQNKLQDTAITTSLKNIIFGLITFNFISELLIFSIGSFITPLLLFLSKLLLESFGYNTSIHGISILLNHSTVMVGTSCLGIRLMVMFSIVLFFLKGSVKSKVVFTIIGIILIFLINVIRISYVLYHLNHYNNYRLTLSIHDLYDYTIYVFTIVLWLIYARWFGNSKENLY